METNRHEQAMQWAVDAARKAGLLLLELTKSPLEISTKSDGSSVTNADFASHASIAADLAGSG